MLAERGHLIGANDRPHIQSPASYPHAAKRDGLTNRERTEKGVIFTGRIHDQKIRDLGVAEDPVIIANMKSNRLLVVDPIAVIV
jgi:hypothetical protein